MSELISLQKKENRYFLSGRLDRDTVPLFWQTRAQWLCDDASMVIDLSELDRIDSAGMAMLLHLQQVIIDKKQNIVFINIPSQLKTLMQLSNIDDFLNQNAA